MSQSIYQVTMPSLQFNIISNTLVFVLITYPWLSDKLSYMYMDQVILETLSPVYQISQQCFYTDTTKGLSSRYLQGWIIWGSNLLAKSVSVIPETCRKYLHSYCIIIIILIFLFSSRRKWCILQALEKQMYNLYCLFIHDATD